ncbi:MAG: hypothetical protein KIT83_21220 [Bryobacterales bacterium]|nr:hypothetical protein [Bryobacterales bacterium]
MKVSRQAVPGATAAALATSPIRGATARSLFNRTDIGGWKQVAVGLWPVEDGAIVC